ncbi:MAG: hypothetical protein ACO1SV_08365 [Fimbriimonas sp.]
MAGGLSAGALWGAWTLWRSQLGGLSLAEEWAAAKREGVPVEMADLIVPPIPESRDATRPFLRAIALTDPVITGTSWESKRQRLMRNSPDSTVARLPSADRKLLKGLIAPLHPAFAALRDAGRKGELPLPRRADKSFKDLRLLMKLVLGLANPHRGPGVPPRPLNHPCVPSYLRNREGT